MAIKILFEDLYKRYCEMYPFYEEEYEIKEINNDKNGFISLYHTKCGNVFTKTKTQYRERCLCSNQDCVRERIEQTTYDKYGVKCSSQSEIVKQKAVDTNMIKYGSTSPFSNNEIKEKIKETNIKKYGVANPMQNNAIVEKSRETCFKKYGVQNPMLAEEVKNKLKNSFIKKYGVDNPNKNKNVMAKRIKTNNKRYGGNAPSSSTDVINKMKNTFSNNYYNNVIMNNSMTTPLFSSDEYVGSKKNKYLFKCKKCGNEFYDGIENGRMPRCIKCYPYFSGTSNIEKEIVDYINKYINVINNKRFFEDNQYKYEIDIFIPEISLGIELDGIYWHSEISGGKDRNYHIDKTKYFESLGIQIIHIFNCEWNTKQDIIKSMLLNKINKIDNKIFARKCSIEILNSSISSSFLNINHLQGNINSNVSIGLKYNDEIVSIMSFGKSRFNKNYEWEMLRFCNKLNTNVVGGFSKLLNYFIKNYSPTSLITYADKRFSNGNVYLNNGFNKLHESKPNYFYIDKNYNSIENRMNYQKHKLKEKLDAFSDELTEWENMQNNNYDRIWDCGNIAFELIL